MGFGMNGMEDRIVAQAQTMANRFKEVTYVEIGVGHGITLSAVAQTLKDSGTKWRAIGVELPNGYSFSEDQTRQWAQKRGVPISFTTPNGTIVRPKWNEVSVYFKDSQSFLTEFWNEPIMFALIDGCHGKPCVIVDFLGVEAFTVKGGVVMFHDFSAEQLGQSQPHCPSGVDVRGACAELGLLNQKRAGWRFVEMLNADRAQGGWDMGIFEKTTR